MKPVSQTRPNITDGDCLQACLASIFEIPLMEVPDFAADPNDEKWWSGVQEWLKGWGYQLLMLAVPADGQPLNFYALPASPWAIFVGPTEKGGHLHAVVGKLDGLDGSGKQADFIVEHDPLAGLAGDITVSFVGFLLPIDPRRPLKKGLVREVVFEDTKKRYRVREYRPAFMDVSDDQREAYVDNLSEIPEIPWMKSKGDVRVKEEHGRINVMCSGMVVGFVTDMEKLRVSENHPMLAHLKNDKEAGIKNN